MTQHKIKALLTSPWFWGMIGLVVLLIAGGIYWFVFRNNSPGASANGANSPTATVENSATPTSTDSVTPTATNRFGITFADSVFYKEAESKGDGYRVWVMDGAGNNKKDTGLSHVMSLINLNQHQGFAYVTAADPSTIQVYRLDLDTSKKIIVPHTKRWQPTVDLDLVSLNNNFVIYSLSYADLDSNEMGDVEPPYPQYQTGYIAYDWTTEKSVALGLTLGTELSWGKEADKIYATGSYPYHKVDYSKGFWQIDLRSAKGVRQSVVEHRLPNGMTWGTRQNNTQTVFYLRSLAGDEIVVDQFKGVPLQNVQLSPDGLTLLYEKEVSNSVPNETAKAIFVYNLQTKKQKELISDRYSDESLRVQGLWVDGGQAVIITSVRASSDEKKRAYDETIQKVNIETGQRTALTTTKTSYL